MNQNASQAKEQIARFWNSSPCGTREFANLTEGNREFFEAIEKRRYTADSFMLDVVPFNEYRNCRILEVGCGTGTDLLQFARQGAIVFGIDLSLKSVELARKRFQIYGMNGTFLQTDSESLPFHDSTFDLVYSWGVIHHAPDTAQAAREILRVCKSGGHVFVMIYHRLSLVSLQAYLLYGLLRGKPFRSIDDIIANHIESLGTKAFTRRAASHLFSGLASQQMQTIVTRYDLRITRNRFLPKWCTRLVPSSLGWNLIIKGRKRSESP
jgi:ubiquinone/menaquinone biosynthesis C-methylase UbiE